MAIWQFNLNRQPHWSPLTISRPSGSPCRLRPYAALSIAFFRILLPISVWRVFQRYAGQRSGSLQEPEESGVQPSDTVPGLDILTLPVVGRMSVCQPSW